ncbi:glutathione S-transferase [Simplicispira suum]|uniref:Glutathione S-transferase n=1 Tax=Simplicispira suum TaxID=2109915 RepID=A0A2S0MVN5_9BURK|nr:glutathione S-transferase [Simplicispira suum]AVO39959.1 glutathione S-transferase [Simplicispira suum]
MPSLPVLYSFRRCPYAIRARLALAVAGTPVALREVVLRHKPDALLAASPKATVPVLVLADASVIDESLSIMHWALAQCDPEGWLGHAGPETDSLIALCDGPFKHALDRCKYPERFPDGNCEASWSAAQRCLDRWEDRLQQGQLCGSSRSLADAAIFPFVRQFAAIEPGRWAAMPLPRLHTWLAAWLASDLFAAVMEKHLPWSEGDAPVRLSCNVAGSAQSAT